MNDIVFQGRGGQPLTNSVLVAETFEKQHSHVIRSIENLQLANPKVDALFVSATYIDEQGKDRPMYIMNRDGFTLLAMGFTGKKALQFKLDYIDAFNKMEQIVKQPQVLPSSSVDMTILKQLVETTQVMAAQINQMQMELNKRFQPALPAMSVSPTLALPQITKEKRISPRQIPYFTVKKIAAEFNATAKKVNAILEAENVQKWNFQKQRWELNSTYQGYDLTYTVVYEPVDPDEEPREYMVWSANGKKFIYDLLKELARINRQY